MIIKTICYLKNRERFLDEYEIVSEKEIDVIVNRSAYCYVHRQSDTQLTIIPIGNIDEIIISADSKLFYF